MQVIAPEHAHIFGANWYCDSGYREVGNTCVQVIAPEHAHIFGANWYCDSGYREVGNTCVAE